MDTCEFDAGWGRRNTSSRFMLQMGTSLMGQLADFAIFLSLSIMKTIRDYEAR